MCVLWFENSGVVLIPARYFEVGHEVSEFAEFGRILPGFPILVQTFGWLVGYHLSVASELAVIRSHSDFGT